MRDLATPDTVIKINDLVEEPARERLRLFVELLSRWKKITNIISEKSFEDVWNRHILDSIHLQKQRPEARVWLDIGSGGGFPSVVIAIVLAEITNVEIHCVEIDRRKCAFLREIASRLNLPIKVHNIFAQNEALSERLAVEIITARAFASLGKFLQITDAYLRQGAIAVLPRGRSVAQEVALLDKTRYTAHVMPNPASADGFFVHIRCRELHNP